MRIAVIGYGSLIWDLDDLAPKVDGRWRRGGGPAMPVEFARVSPKRKMGLVLVIHAEVDHHSPTSYVVSHTASLDQAIGDLAARERTDRDHIGFADRTGKVFSRSPVVAKTVSSWLEDSECDAAVWTDLDGNFTEHTGETFSHQAGLGYLKTLSGQSLHEAWRYITYAPDETDTPFRRFLREDDWWQAMDFHAPESAS